MSYNRELTPFEDDDSSASRMLRGLMSPAPAQALVAPPPDRPAWSGPGESTPITGSLATAPSQATPKVSPAPVSSAQEQGTGQAGLKNKIRRGLGAYFSVQPIGSRDANSGRLITQPTDNPAVNQTLATDAMRIYRSGLQAAIKNIPGAELVASRNAKNPARLAEKIALEGQPAQTVSDYGAAQIAVDSPQTKNAVIASVKKRFPVVRVMDHFAKGDPEYGYRTYSMQVQMPNSASEELQIVPKEVFAVNRAEHKNYKKARNAELLNRRIDGKNAEAYRAAAKAQNNAAMAKFDLRNESSAPHSSNLRLPGTPTPLAKGSAVALPDGSRGVVLYLDRNLKIARIRTEDGRNMTVRQGQLTVVS